jgi:hypothetical protein
MKRIDELETVLLGLDEVRDCVAVRRTAVDGQTWTVIYFVPTAGPAGGAVGGRAGGPVGERVRQVAEAAARSTTRPTTGSTTGTTTGPAIGPVAVVPVRRVPRSADGTPDLPALAEVPVLTADTLRACAAEWRVGVEAAPVDPGVPALPLADLDADLDAAHGADHVAGRQSGAGRSERLRERAPTHVLRR